MEPGDFVVMRDQSRLGREMLRTARLLKKLISERRAHVFYYSDGIKVSLDGAVDELLAVVRGFGAHFELDEIRSRTREAIRRRVESGRVAGGACYGYRNVHRTDDEGRQFTAQEVDPEQAKVVRRIFEMKRTGRGYREIAILLNSEGVPKPKQGKRGTGSWSLSGVRTIILNPRYRGVIVHGRVVEEGYRGTRRRVKAPESEVIRKSAPHLRIIDDELWHAVQPKPRSKSTKRHEPNRRHPLSGVGRCAVCGGPMTVRNSRDGKNPRPVYACAYHRNRGNAVCDNRLMRPKEAVEEAVIGYLRDSVLTETMVTEIVRRVRERLKEHRSVDRSRIREMEKEARKLRNEERRLVDAVGVQKPADR